MTLKRGGAPAAAALDYEIEEVPGEIPRGRGGRPKIRELAADGTESDVRFVTMTRASTLGKSIEDTYHLSRWGRRNVVLGMSRRTDLVALAAAIPENEGEHRGPLDEIADKAHEAAQGDRGANIGTALHKLSERRDAGDDLSYLPEALLAAMDAYSRCMAPLRVLASETFVVCDELGAAGTFDRVVMLLVDLTFEHEQPDGSHVTVTIPAGTVLVLDLKTGKVKSADYWGAVYGVQQVVYSHGRPYTHTAGRGSWAALLGEDVPAPSQRWALILHVPSDSPDDAGLIVVDLEIGYALAELAIDVRAGRKAPGLLTPAYVATEQAAVTPQEAARAAIEAGPASAVELEHAERIAAGVAPGGNTKPVPLQVRKALLMAELRQAPDEDALVALWETSDEEVWQPEHTHMVKARLAELAGAADGAAVPA